ncbi:MAG: hypothetical protein ACOY93_03475 [Bacillota bacterium]
MPSEADRWKTGPLRNTAGHTEGPTGPVTGGVEGHVKSEDRPGNDLRPEKQKERRGVDDPAAVTGAG